ncbi:MULTISPECIES: hypothetical protein [Bacteroides]|uniref:Uncharacterized protein n=1 Tax=Bacteroides muris (ex Fokt et al. 2023) TaxID=2937417 RepID=A0A9X2SWC3_9BACE|nr:MULTISPECIES: hypothetical protein [Bacteroides]MCR6505979.1 hypothetical protein [Bacteroides muris (ex Fokt et al. 2023)]MCR6507557.1 hypothetical protein [Bacteroides muris (ex Fokt et al. 2023)]
MMAFRMKIRLSKQAGDVSGGKAVTRAFGCCRTAHWLRLYVGSHLCTGAT